MIRLAASACAFVLLAGTATAEPVAYEFDKSHSNLSFTFDHLGYSTTDGRFGDWDGALIIDKDTPENSSVEFTIKIDSLDTFWQARDEHLLSADYFDAARFPKATFKSTAVEQSAENQLEVTGDLTIRGITKPTVLSVDVTKMAEHPMLNKDAVGFAVTTVINRSEFGMDGALPFVGDEITITFHTETLTTATTN